MSLSKSFIPIQYRPKIKSGCLNKKHRPKFLLEKKEIREGMPELKVDAIAFGPKSDQVLLSLEHAVTAKETILFFYYEDIHKRWSYCRTNQESYFLFKKNEDEEYKITARCIYIRGCQVTTDDPAWRILGEFYNFVDSWEGKVLCAPKNQNNNESKLYQLTQSIKKACIKKPSISIGKSYVIKGKAAFDKLKDNQSYIVKSLSGTRSIVVDETKFNLWDKSNLGFLPVLFQEKVSGNDLRVHTLNDKCYGKVSVSKESVDYRYDSQFFSLLNYEDFSEEMIQFCKDLILLEDNSFLGIDFIKTSQGYVVLEANPSPGWSAYYPCDGIENDEFVNDLIFELKHV